MNPTRLLFFRLLKLALLQALLLTGGAAFAQQLDLAPRLLYQIEGEAPDQRFGGGVWPMDDVDGDGFQDLLITDYWNGSIEPPSARVWVESACVYSGADGRKLFELEYDYPEVSNLAFAGSDFAYLGDLDGDGIGDFIAGDSNRDLYESFPRDGFATVFSGKTGKIIRTHRSSEAGFGAGTQALGDLDGDGIFDYSIETQVGTILGGNPSTVAIHSGASGEKRATITGFGTRPLGVTDLDGDGLADFAIVDEANNAVWFLSGALEGNHAIGNIPSEHVLGRFQNDVLNVVASWTAHTLQNVGDLDGDGFDEIVARIDERPAAGIGPRGLIAISSKTAQLVWVHELSVDGQNHQNESLEPLTRISDLSGDGVPELITMDKFALGGGAGIPAIWQNGVLVLSGADGQELDFLSAEQLGSGSTRDTIFAREIAALSDLDGDGVEEVAISDRNWKDDTGRVLVYSFGPGRETTDFAAIRRNPPLEIQVDAEKLSVTWPPAVENVTLEISHDLIEWATPQAFYEEEQRLYSIPHDVRQAAAYFRLRKSQ